MAQWVRSRYSEETIRWKVLEVLVFSYKVDGGGQQHYYLPKSEYIECDPPTRWEVCTREVVNIQCPIFNYKTRYKICLIENGKEAIVGNGLRWSWSGKDPNALVIERKVEG